MAAPVTVKVRIFQFSPDDFDWKAMLAALAKLKVGSRYFDRGLGRKALGVAFPKNDTIGLWSIRQSAALDLHDGGVIRPWDLPSEVAEGSYFRFFPDGTVTTVVKGHGPTPTVLSAYLDALGFDVDFNPVLRGETGDYVASIDDARSVVLAVDSQAGLNVLREVDEGLGAAVGSLLGASDGTRISIEIGGRDADEKSQMWHKLRHPIRALAERDDIGAMRAVKLRVPGEIRGTEELDLLKDRIAFQMEVPLEGVTQANAPAVLRGAYDRFRAEYGDE